MRSCGELGRLFKSRWSPSCLNEGVMGRLLRLAGRCDLPPPLSPPALQSVCARATRKTPATQHAIVSTAPTARARNRRLELFKKRPARPARPHKSAKQNRLIVENTKGA
jgi:hypothetical protein